jgi:hypothetical protein
VDETPLEITLVVVLHAIYIRLALDIVDNEHYEKNADQAAAIKEALVGGGATEDQITTLDGMADAKAKEALDGVRTLGVHAAYVPCRMCGGGEARIYVMSVYMYTLYILQSADEISTLLSSPQ